jgi:hypothetical protein
MSNFMLEKWTSMAKIEPGRILLAGGLASDGHTAALHPVKI